MNNLIKRGSYVAEYPINGDQTHSPLTFVVENRDLMDKHISKMRQRLQEFGWLDVIKITPTGIILEGQHRVKAAIEADETTVPVYILDWVGDDEQDDVRDIITSLNNGQKAWLLFDWAKTYKDQSEGYRAIYEALLKSGKVLSNGVIFTIFTGKKTLTSFPTFTKGDYKKLEKPELSYWLLDEIENLVITYGKSKFPAQTIRSLAACSFKEDVEGVVPYVFRHIKSSMTMMNSVIPEGDTQFTEFYQKLKADYIELKSTI